MKEELQKRVDLFIENKDKIKAEFPKEAETLSILCAALIGLRNREADPKKMRKSLEIVRENTGVFSSFRGSLRMPIITKMSLTGDSKDFLYVVQKNYNALSGHKWMGNIYQILASMIMYEYVERKEVNAMVSSTKAIYAKMKKTHPFYTSQEDCTFAALLAMTDRNEDEMLADIEKMYKILKERFKYNRNATLALAHVLYLNNDDIDTKCKKVIDIYDALKDKGVKFTTTYEFVTLGVITNLDVDIETIASDIYEVNLFLKKDKAFGMLGVGRSERHMYACMGAVSLHMENIEGLMDSALNDNVDGDIDDEYEDNNTDVIDYKLSIRMAEEMALLLMMTGDSESALK